MGYQTLASGEDSEAQGSLTQANATWAHAEGANTVANGEVSHVEGVYSTTTSAATGAHAEGYNTLAASAWQHVEGKNNIEDANGVYAKIVGNGTDTTRSNAFTLDWSGNGWFSGAVTIGEDAKALATEDYAEGLVEWGYF